MTQQEYDAMAYTWAMVGNSSDTFANITGYASLDEWAAAQGGVTTMDDYFDGSMSDLYDPWAFVDTSAISGGDSGSADSSPGVTDIGVTPVFDATVYGQGDVETVPSSYDFGLDLSLPDMPSEGSDMSGLSLNFDPGTDPTKTEAENFLDWWNASASDPSDAIALQSAAFQWGIGSNDAGWLYQVQASTGTLSAAQRAAAVANAVRAAAGGGSGAGASMGGGSSKPGSQLVEPPKTAAAATAGANSMWGLLALGVVVLLIFRGR